ncbi:hypothetical protein QBC44DRAFT_385925 [Cladorrhinum sp. PSN332]|nr:hypothetical protein QBC44DRAFT_385925 [Cladorrhinum sp. PSN332]
MTTPTAYYRLLPALVIIISLFTAPALSDHPKPSEPTCYAPDGSTIANASLFSPCNRLGITQANAHSSCCQLGGDPPESRDLCAITGLCLNNGIVRRGFCTDPSWKSPACVKVCDDPDAGGSPDSFAEMTSCTDGTYCCGRNNLTCCGTGWAVKPPMLMVNAPSATVTVTAAADAAKQRSDRMTIVGLGAGLGGVVVVAAGAVWYLMRRIRVLSAVQRSSAQLLSVTRRSSPGGTPLLVSSFERAGFPGGIVSPRAMYNSQEPWGPDSYSLKYTKTGRDGHVPELDSAALSEAGIPDERRAFVQPMAWDDRRYTG